MRLKAISETQTGLNTQFVNTESGRQVSLEHVIHQIENGNKNYDNYQKVTMSNGTIYVRSKSDGKLSNNIE